MKRLIRVAILTVIMLMCLPFLFAGMLMWSSSPAGANLTPSSIAVHTHASNAQGGTALSPASLTPSSPVEVANGGTGAATAAAARTNLGAAASGANSDITSLTGLTGSVTSAKACETGYTRMTPNYCMQATYVSTPSLTRDVCTTVTIAAGARFVDVNAIQNVRSANSVNLRFADVGFYTNNGCGTLLRYAGCQFRETTAVANNTTLLACSTTTRVPLDGSGNVYMRLNDDAGNFGGALYYISGYGD